MSRRPKAVFESWRGRYADSPRAISERLSERCPDLTQVWVAGRQENLPTTVGRIARHSPQHFWQLARADYVVSNDIVTRYPVHRASTRYLQTWHGTPLKKIGHDENNPVYDDGAHMARVDRDVTRWSALLSTGPECTEMFRSAFRFDGPILEAGLPRNDVLCSAGADGIRSRVRNSLGLADDAVAVLWTPTWRDHVSDGAGGFGPPGGLDIPRFLSATPDRVVLLMRMHSVVTAGPDVASNPRLIDVTDHSEISDLYLASDVLVSDYSSAIYDYAVLDRPIVLFAHDLEEYLAVRDMYFDYETWAPGPITRRTGELAECISSIVLHGPDAAHRQRLDAFRANYCPHEDGGATDRAIDAFFSPLL